MSINTTFSIVQDGGRLDYSDGGRPPSLIFKSWKF